MLITSLLVLSYLLYQFRTSYNTITWIEISKKVFFLLILIGSLFITNFITKKNGLSKDDSFTFLLFFTFLLLFPKTLSSDTLIISNAFILLALRRLISMQSLVNVKEKIFDASLWIFAASLFNFWVILFLLLVFTSIIIHASRDYKNWIIPFIAFLVVLVLSIFFSLLINPSEINNYIQSITIDVNFYYITSIFQSISLLIYGVFATTAFVSMLFILPTKMSNYQSAYRKILFAFIIGITIFILSFNKDNSLLLFTFVPVSIMLTNLLESIKKYWIKESILVILLLASIVSFVLRML
jgi:hypothetical protein